MKKNEQMILFILENKTIELQSRYTLPDGNLDGESINDLFGLHGIKLNCSDNNYRPDLLKSIKDKRNDLAHGSVSFVEALRNLSIGDIEKSSKIVLAFLEQTIKLVNSFIKKQKYRAVL